MKPLPSLAAGVVLVFGTFVIVTKAEANTATITASADTSIYQNYPDYNMGGATLLSGTNQQPGTGRALIRFSLSGIPANATITSVAVNLSVIKVPDPDQHPVPPVAEFDLHRLLLDWGQGTGASATGNPANPGDATWNQRMYQQASWSSPGGAAGLDYASDVSSSAQVSGKGDYSFGNTPLLLSDVQGWLSNPSTNFGLMLICADEGDPGSARRFASLEQTLSIGTPPQLVVTYTVPEASGAALLMLGSAALGFRRSHRGGAVLTSGRRRRHSKGCDLDRRSESPCDPWRERGRKSACPIHR